MPVINQLWPSGPADTRMHDRPARPTAFCWNQNCPRICGEKSVSKVETKLMPGLPPHMRGKGIAKTVNKVILRITPACAGKRTLWWRTATASWDHPRICGEKGNWDNGSNAGLGSPPHMRGKGQALLADDFGVGITPAYAGKRVALRSGCGTTRDHPRIYGEKPLYGVTLTAAVGSPPHMRGKVPSLRNDLARVGITPACAGKSWPGYTVPCLCRDHPRICGEKRVSHS